MATRLGNPTVRINNDPIWIIPNSFEYDEGEGETTVETQASGTDIDIVTSDSAEDKMSTFKFDVTNTQDNIERLRGLKKNPGNNVVDVSEDGLTKVFTQASITNSYTVELKSTGKITVEWKSRPAI